MKVAVIGGGAAGFFSAITVKRKFPNASVTIFEKSKQVLSKVKISGGGRCNVTNACTDLETLSKAYPRGGKSLKKLFHTFNTSHTFKWFEACGIPLTIEEDGRVFPASNTSQTVVDGFLKEINKLGIDIRLNTGVSSIKPAGDLLDVGFLNGLHPSEQFDKIIVAVGGVPKRNNLEWLERLGHDIKDPVPSLFTFNTPGEPIRELMGISIKEAYVSIQGTKLKSEGSLLITHWGMSGPAILKLSAFGARFFSEYDYNFSVQINWVGQKNQSFVLQELEHLATKESKKKLSNFRPFNLPSRLWLFLLKKTGVSEDSRWETIGKKNLNKLVITLTNDQYKVQGKTTFKEEFVTCGGISLNSINIKTMQSKSCKNLYFAGEILDIDAITGGFNFQAAWTTGFVAGQLNES